MNQGLINLLTICRKAGRLCTGFDKCKEMLACGKAKSVFISSDISEKTEKEVRFFAAKKNIPVKKVEVTQDEFRLTLGKQTGIVTVCDDGFSKKALLLAENADN